MGFLIAVLLALVLLAGFFVLTALERRRGARLLLPARRALLDREAARAAFIIRHVDFGTLVAHTARTWLERAAHDVAHQVLVFVRFLERSLTRTVLWLRRRNFARTNAPAGEPGDTVLKE